MKNRNFAKCLYTSTSASVQLEVNIILEYSIKCVNKRRNYMKGSQTYICMYKNKQTIRISNSQQETKVKHSIDIKT